MKQGIYTITENRPLTADVWEMRLSGDTSPLTAPGQFINIKLEGFFLRRPISVCDWDEAGLTIIYKVVGRGTAAMAAMVTARAASPVATAIAASRTEEISSAHSSTSRPLPMGFSSRLAAQ